MLKLSELKQGFTVIELLVVIVVIGVLASITIIVNNGAQADARDTQRRSDVHRIADALEIYFSDHGDFLEAGSGCGSSGGGNGWFSYTGGTYTKSISDCLKDGGYLAGGAQDPQTGPNGTSTPTTGFAYMKYHCTISGEKKAYVFAKLETLPSGSTNPINSSEICSHTAVDTSYGMNYYVEVR
jgi:prepilin-type N-terminal cleavage/methylation domain-containing protein